MCIRLKVSHCTHVCGTFRHLEDAPKKELEWLCFAEMLAELLGFSQGKDGVSQGRPFSSHMCTLNYKKGAK